MKGIDGSAKHREDMPQLWACDGAAVRRIEALFMWGELEVWHWLF
jgi:hypothetical protein